MLDQDPFWVPTTEEELEDLGEKADKENVARRASAATSFFHAQTDNTPCSTWIKYESERVSLLRPRLSKPLINKEHFGDNLRTTRLVAPPDSDVVACKNKHYIFYKHY